MRIGAPGSGESPDPRETFGAGGSEREVDVNEDGCRPNHRMSLGFSWRIAAAGGALAGAAGLLAAGSAAAAVPSESQFVLNTFSFLVWGRW